MLSKAERTKQFIIEQTASVFNSKGFAGTSMSDIVSVTGLTKGSVYGNFENKDDLALSVFDYNFGTVVNYLKSKMDEKKSMIDKLLVYPDTYRNFLELPFLKAGCPVLNTSVEADDTHPLLKKKATDALVFWKKSIEHIIQKGIELGEIKKDVIAFDFAAVLMSLLEGAIMQAKVTNQTNELNATMNFLEKLIIELRV